MDDKFGVLSFVMSTLTYLTVAANALLAFLGTYSLGFGVIFAGITCWLNWRVQKLRVRLLLSKSNDVDI